MDDFYEKGVVLNGRVVLDVPLEVPDGTLVTIQRYEEDDRDDTGKPLRDRVRQLSLMVDMLHLRLRKLEPSAAPGGGQEAA